MNEDFALAVSRLSRECDAIQCPDCGGYHGVRFRLMYNGEISEPIFQRGVLGAPCWGYMHLVKEKISNLKSRYNMDERP